ncbi:glycosyltransferase family 4 protein [Lapillicoccus sp.]|uniref:glycosyltransferase family 4 protein n=1 Tax=Lapillicoccus sp. TaxID=1909287 RepID=UPI003982E501
MHRSQPQHDRPLTVLIANPSADVYGSDLQMLESVGGLKGHRWRVVVALPTDGPLVPLLRGRGAEIRFIDFPVLRRANATPTGMPRLGARVARRLGPMLRFIAEVGPDVVYVNTTTLPWWLLAAWLRRIPVVAHLHEAASGDGATARRALATPLWLSTLLIANSRPTLQTLCESYPRLRTRTRVIANGVPGPPDVPQEPTRGQPWRIALVSRLSPRKSIETAMEAIALLRARGVDVRLEVYGSAFSGYEWFAERLVERARRPDLEGAVTFHGYTSPIWPALAQADLLVAPSPWESFGNCVVEAQLALRPVVVAGAMGHLEIVTPGVTGILATPDDPGSFASGIRRLMDNPDLARSIAEQAREQALSRFSLQRYADEVDAVMKCVVGED